MVISRLLYLSSFVEVAVISGVSIFFMKKSLTKWPVRSIIGYFTLNGEYSSYNK
jgi:hypothetical protein